MGKGKSTLNSKVPQGKISVIPITRIGQPAFYPISHNLPFYEHSIYFRP